MVAKVIAIAHSFTVQTTSWGWLEWRLTNSWLCHRTVTVVMKWLQNNF